MSRKIVEKVSVKQLQRDLEKYRGKAIDLGATDAKIITADMIIIDERVRAKCSYPKCEWYGTNAHCPPRSMEIKDVRELVSKFKYGIFCDIQVPSKYFADSRVKSALRMYEIISKIEADAFYDGYYLALGFACGPCKFYFCPKQECTALISGQGCRHAGKARSSMEGMGMDVYMMATMVGWDIYPIGARTQPSNNIPHVHRLGLVLIN
jgi:predicted metal-binding protein